MTTKKQSPSKATKIEETVQPSELERLDKVEASIADLTSMMSDMVGMLREAKSPQVMPIVQKPEARIEAMANLRKDGDMGHSSRIRDLVNPRAQDTGFQQHDIIEVRESSPKFMSYRLKEDGSQAMPARPAVYKDSKLIKEAVEAEDGTPAKGVVLKYMYSRRKDGLRKYKVEFPGIGRDGFLETELVRV